LLRHDARSVAHERELIVSQIAAMTGLRVLWPLENADFRRLPGRPVLLTIGP
jgi:hypothetical protein